MSKRSCDALKLDKMRFGSIGYRRFNFETSAPACPGTTCTNDLPNLALKQWRVHSQAGKFAVVFGVGVRAGGFLGSRGAAWAAFLQSHRLEALLEVFGFSRKGGLMAMFMRKMTGNHWMFGVPYIIAWTDPLVLPIWPKLGLDCGKNKQTENGAILGQQSLAIFGGQYQLYTQLHI